MMRGLRTLARDARGATLLEFAIISPVFLLMIMGMLDIAHQMYARAVLTGAVQKAGRDSMLQSGPTNINAIDARVWEAVRGVVPDGTFATTRRSTKDFANTNASEPYTDSNGNGVRNPGECYQDINRNGSWSADASTDGQGGASDSVLYTATVTFQNIFPMPSMLSAFGNSTPMSRTITIRASTLLRNQPYAAETMPPVICA